MFHMFLPLLAATRISVSSCWLPNTNAISGGIRALSLWQTSCGKPFEMEPIGI